MRRGAAKALVGMVKATAGTLDRARPPAPGVVVLLYHRVGGGSGTEVDLDPGVFEQQMAVLAERRQPLALDEALAMLWGNAPPPSGDPVVVTFDDGTADFIDNVVPIALRNQVPLTLYVATDFVEQRREFPGRGRPVSWAGLADVLTTGMVTVGSHTHTHALLDRRPGVEVDYELDRSMALIEDRLGVTPAHFAYPKALAPSREADRAVRARFRSAALAGTRPNRYGRTDPHRLARSPVQRSDGMRWFASKLAGGMALEDDLRRLANRVRYLGATT
ncbi:MAG: polysaccharide deacetylase family protein [Anaerolineales bacterium]